MASLHKNLALTAALNQLYQTPGFPRLILWHHDLAWTTPRYRPELHEGYPWELLCSKWTGVTHVTVSKVRRTELSELLDITPESIHIIPNGLDLNTFFKFEPRTLQVIEQLNLEQADPLFLLPARLTPRKNIELALHITAEAAEGLPKGHAFGYRSRRIP